MQINKYYSSFFEESPPYNSPLFINTEKECFKHLFPSKTSEEPIAEALTAILQTDLEGETFSRFLQESTYHPETSSHRITTLINQGWTQYGSREEYGLILEHPTLLPDWLIKKNYSASTNLTGEARRLGKVIHYTSLPVWMLPHSHPRRENPADETEDHSLFVPNDIINPLRVVVLHRGEQFIRELFLDCIAPCQEYIFSLPDAPARLPLHRRVIVISKKMNIFSPRDNFTNLTRLFNEDRDYFIRLVTQICLFIKYTRMTDMHLGNLSFIRPENTDELPRQVTFFDGEPLGSLFDEALLAHAEEEDDAPNFSEFDRGAFSLLGLLKLKRELEKKLHRLEREQNDNIPTESDESSGDQITTSGNHSNISQENGNTQQDNTQQMIRAFCEVIEATENQINRERMWFAAKNRFPLLWIVFFAIACIRTACEYIGFTRQQQRLSQHSPQRQ
jgi:hypothetical protein